eukprot:2978328-Prymnesium_polylepis.1
MQAHRIHVPLIVPQCVQFAQWHPATASETSPRGGRAQRGRALRGLYAARGKSTGSVGKRYGKELGNWTEVPMKEGEAFEVNNKIKHRVQQTGPYERVTLVLDVAETPCARYVEVSPSCASWDDPRCVVDFDVTPEEWLYG